MNIKKIIKKGLERVLPKNIYNLVLLAYIIGFINIRFLFKPFGFWNKTRFDIEKLFNIKLKRPVHIGEFVFCPEGAFLLYESFNVEPYRPLLTCSKVLNLGGFIGDSAIYLSRKCKKVYVFEPEKEKFKIMSKNVHNNKLQNKIILFKFAAVGSSVKKIIINKNDSFDIDSSITHYNFKASLKEEVKCMHIKDILDIDHFDGLECDIEGAEWEIINFFLRENTWSFNKAIFELHFSKEKFSEELIIFNKFLNFLKKKGKTVVFYNDSPKKTISFEDIEIIPDEKHKKRVIMMYIK